MFFSISKTKLENFPCAYHFSDFVINTDNGWQQVDVDDISIVYKGYIDQCNINHSIADVVEQLQPECTGNFCAFVVDNAANTISVKTDKYRSFPIFFTDGECVTNLQPLQNTAWTNNLVSINKNLNVKIDKFNLVGQIDTAELSADEVLSRINDILDKRTQQLIEHNSTPLKVFLTGGVDTMLVYSYLRKHRANFELVNGTHFDWDYFWIKNSGDIQKFWGYNQMLHWNAQCILASGAPGDEFMLRSPSTVDTYLKNHNIKISSLLDQPQWQNCLHRDYFQQTKHTQIFESLVPMAKTSIHLHWNLYNNVLNDWQHWHLGNTLTWTPLRDLEIFKLMLRLPLTDAIGQIMNSSLSRELIDRNVPGLSKHISDRKNSGNTLSNLVGLID